MSQTIRKNCFSDKLMSVAEASYVAGLFDGEGTTGLYRKGWPEVESRYLTPNCSIANTSLEVMEYLVEVTGNGGVWKKSSPTPLHRECYKWSITAQQMRHILPQIQPYLVIKARQVELVLSYLSLVRYRRGIADADLPEAMRIWEKLHDLNVRGGTEESRQAAAVRAKKTECEVEGCSRRQYRGHSVCQHHFMVDQERRAGNCQHCGVEMVVDDVRKRFCSQKCQVSHWYETVRKPALEAEAAARPSVPCPACGNDVDRTNHADKKFCNDHCQAVYRARLKKKSPDFALDKVCAHCEVAFKTKFGKQKYCSDACNKAAYVKRISG